MKPSKCIKSLFISQTRTKLIKIFFSNPSEIYYVRQLVRLTKEEINSVRRELKNLENAHLIQKENRGNRLYYGTNPDSCLFYDLVLISNQLSFLASKLSSKTKVKMLLYSFNFATRQSSQPDQVDLIIIGSVPVKSVESLIQIEEKARDREINYMIMDNTELELRKNRRDPFIIDFFLNCPLIIIGNPQKVINL